MATFTEIAVSAGFNIFAALFCLIAFTILRIQPCLERFYYPRRYLMVPTTRGLPTPPAECVNPNWRQYIGFLSWVTDALRVSEEFLIYHIGLDSVVYQRIHLLGLKIFLPMTLFGCCILVPINWNNNALEKLYQQDNKLKYSSIDKLSLSNIPLGSPWIWTHVVMAYVFTLWTCYVLREEYATIAAMRLVFLESQNSCPNHFTVLVRNVPPAPDVTESVRNFFLTNYPDHYLTHQVVISANKLVKLVKMKKKSQNKLDYYNLKHSRNPTEETPKIKTGFLGFWGDEVDAIDHQKAEIRRLTTEIETERRRVTTDPKYIMPAAFVSFKTRWAASVCAETQQSSNPTLWLTGWAVEPRDVYWPNLGILYGSLTVRRVIANVALFFLTFFFVIPVSFVQSVANLKTLEKHLDFLIPIIEWTVLKSIIEAILPGLTLKVFLIVLPTLLMIVSKFEGLISISSLERRSALRHHVFNFVNVFIVSIIAGTVLADWHVLHGRSPHEIFKTIRAAIPMKATFFMTYVMVDAWFGCALEISRMTALIWFQLKKCFTVKTDEDMKKATDAGSIGFNFREPQIQLYFLMGLVFAVVSPLLLPFVVSFFAIAYVTFRHQMIEVYNQDYESGGAFWPDIHGRIVFTLIFSHLVLMVLMGGLVEALVLIVLPISTFFFYRHCKCRYEPIFVKYPLQNTRMKDAMDTEPPDNYLLNTYLHPVLKEEEEDEPPSTDPSSSV